MWPECHSEVTGCWADFRGFSPCQAVWGSSPLPRWLVPGARQGWAVLILWSSLLLTKEEKEDQMWQQQLLTSVPFPFPSHPCLVNLISSGKLVSSFSHAAARRRTSKSLVLVNIKYLAGNWNKVAVVTLVSLDKVWMVPHLSQVWELLTEDKWIRRNSRQKGILRLSA